MADDGQQQETLTPEEREAWLTTNLEKSENWTDAEILLAKGAGIN